jgi:PAS domain S-box-containing protein
MPPIARNPEMTKTQASRIRQSAAQYVLGCIGLASLTFACFSLELNLATAGFLFLILITLLSLTGTFVESAILSFIAVGCLNYYFAPPIFSLRIDYPQDAVLVVTFLLTALIVTRLVGGARRQLKEALMAKERLQQSESNLAEAQRLTHTGSWAQDISTGALFTSPELLRIYGRDPNSGTLSLADFVDSVHPEDRPFVAQIAREARNEGVDFQFNHRIILPDASVKHVHSVAHPVFDDLGNLVQYVGTIVDVTERARDEARLQRQTALLDELFESAPEAVAFIDLDGRVIRANREFGTLFGYASEETAGRTLLELIVPDDQSDNASALIANYKSGARVAIECQRRRKDGERIHVAHIGAPIMLDGKPIGVYAIYRDITERVLAQAEREQLEQRLRQAEKMEAVGRLAGGIAHDFNNVLAGVFAYGEMLFEETPADSPLKRYARNVLTAAARGRALVEQILAYSRSQLGKRAPVDVTHVVAETLELLRGSTPGEIRLESSAPESPLVMIGDATQLHQVVMNVCSNAIQAMNGAGALRVALDASDVFAERALSHGRLGPGRYVRLSIQDSGSGMDPATLARIFEPFFTTKEIGRGTGLGLSLVHAIVADAGGAIDVRSALGRGSMFTIYLARAEAALAGGGEAPQPLPRGSGERVLLVDDEPQLLAMTAEVLTRLGYHPVSFSDSDAALAAFKAEPGSFDVVFIDDVMPGLTGTGLAAQVRRQRPDLPIVLVSGYAGPTLTQQALAAGVSELLAKPLLSRQIAATLARLLNRSRGWGSDPRSLRS